jgi:hypothetical protein
MILRKLVLVAVLVMFAAGLTGCYTIKVGGNGQQLASSNESGNLIGEKRVWYALWGLVPISDNTTDSMAPAAAKKVKFETTHTFVDFVISFFTGIVSIVCNTAEVYEVK